MISSYHICNRWSGGKTPDCSARTFPWASARVSRYGCSICSEVNQGPYHIHGAALALPVVDVGGELEDEPAVLPPLGLGGESLQPLDGSPSRQAPVRDRVLNAYQVQLQRGVHRLLRPAPQGSYRAVVFIFRREEDGYKPLLGQDLVQKRLIAVQVEGAARAVEFRGAANGDPAVPLGEKAGLSEGARR